MIIVYSPKPKENPSVSTLQTEILIILLLNRSELGAQAERLKREVNKVTQALNYQSHLNVTFETGAVVYDPQAISVNTPPFLQKEPDGHKFTHSAFLIAKGILIIWQKRHSQAKAVLAVHTHSKTEFNHYQSESNGNFELINLAGEKTVEQHLAALI